MSTGVTESLCSRGMLPSRGKIFRRSDANFDTRSSTTCSGSQGGSAHAVTCPCDPRTSILPKSWEDRCASIAHVGHNRLDTPSAEAKTFKYYVITCENTEIKKRGRLTLMSFQLNWIKSLLDCRSSSERNIRPIMFASQCVVKEEVLCLRDGVNFFNLSRKLLLSRALASNI